MKLFLIKLSLLATPSLLWAGNFIFARHYRAEFYPYDLAFYRWTTALLLVWLFYGGLTRQAFPLLWQHKWQLFFLALLSVTGYNTLLYYGLSTTTALNAAFINSAIPLQVIILSWCFFKVVPRGRDWLGILLSISGVIIIVTHGQLSILTQLQLNTGDIFILASATTWALYSVWLPQLLNKALKPQVILCALVTTGWVIMLPYFLYRLGAHHFGTLKAPIQPLSLNGIIFVVYVGVFASVVAYRVWNKCVAELGANLSGLSLNLLPFFTAIAAILFLNETLHGYHFWGGIAIISSLFLIFVRPQRRA